MREDLFVALALFLPILAANQGPGLARKMNLPLAYMPVSRRWLGENKTVAAYYAGPLLAALIFYLYRDTNWLTDGLVIGLGAVLGDHVKSFTKRQLRRLPGSKWWPDRIDFAVGGSLAAIWQFEWVTWVHVLYLIVIAWPVHYFGNQLSHRLGWRNTPH